MGTSEEIRNDQHYRHHASHNNNNSNHPGMLLAHPSSTPSSTPSTSAVHAYKLADDDSTHDHHQHHQQGHGVAMEVDPSCDYNEPKSPSPTHYGSSAFPYAEQQQQNYAGLVATPITRFLTKQTFGFIPKPSFPSPSEGIGRSTPSSPALQSAQSKLQALRLPSLLPPGSGNSSLPQSPLQSPQPPPSFSLPAGETLSRLFNSASLDAGSAPSTPTASRGSTVTLPPLKRACPSPTTPLPPLAQQLSLDDICKPFRYQRSLSCPSDTMARAAAEEAAYEAYSAPRALLQFADVPKNRLERSNSMDVGAVLAAREAHARALHGDGGPNGYESSSHHYSTPMDYQGWLDRPHMNRHPLASLAESAHAMQRLEQHDSNHLESPRGATSPSESGGESSTNPFAINAEEFKREKKLCAFPQCSSNAVTRGLCISHGGGRRCQRKGCTRGAQSKGLCVAHGGGRICRAKGCSNIQRSMGLCIRHGGGKRCSVAGCQKGVVRQDLCTAHGGKRKCRVEDCNKHVKKKGLCRSHANSVLGASAMSPSHDYMSDHSD